LPKQPTPSATPAKAGTGKKWEAEADRKKREAGERKAAAEGHGAARDFKTFPNDSEVTRRARIWAEISIAQDLQEAARANLLLPENQNPVTQRQHRRELERQVQVEKNLHDALGD
jgi:hypothetical protein